MKRMPIDAGKRRTDAPALVGPSRDAPREPPHAGMPRSQPGCERSDADDRRAPIHVKRLDEMPPRRGTVDRSAEGHAPWVTGQASGCQGGLGHEGPCAMPTFHVKQPALTMATEPVERQRHDERWRGDRRRARRRLVELRARWSGRSPTESLITRRCRRDVVHRFSTTVDPSHGVPTQAKARATTGFLPTTGSVSVAGEIGCPPRHPQPHPALACRGRVGLDGG